MYERRCRYFGRGNILKLKVIKINRFNGWRIGYWLLYLEMYLKYTLEIKKDLELFLEYKKLIFIYFIGIIYKKCSMVDFFFLYFMKFR